jgi:hypothetical protein
MIWLLNQVYGLEVVEVDGLHELWKMKMYLSKSIHVDSTVSGETRYWQKKVLETFGPQYIVNRIVGIQVWFLDEWSEEVEGVESQVVQLALVSNRMNTVETLVDVENTMNHTPGLDV